LPSIDLKAYARRGAEARRPETWRGQSECSDSWCWRGETETQADVSRAAQGSGPSDEGVLGGEESKEGTITARTRKKAAADAEADSELREMQCGSDLRGAYRPAMARRHPS